MATIPFSDDMKHVIAEARLTALDLGSVHISTLHFFLADCQLHPISSLNGLLFNNLSELKAFYDSLRVGPPIPVAGSIPLTVEAERVLRKAKAECSYYRDVVLQPCHLFSAASKLPNASFSSLLTDKALTAKEVENYYVRQGQLRIPSPTPSVSQRFFSSLKQLVGRN